MITPEGCIAEVIERLATFIIGYRAESWLSPEAFAVGRFASGGALLVKIVAKYRSAPTRLPLFPCAKAENGSPDTR
ncbi:hypothetical protein DMH88_16495 [Escherichia coli]|nr:hypothetical protein [Escherichia coli]